LQFKVLFMLRRSPGAPLHGAPLALRRKAARTRAAGAASLEARTRLPQIMTLDHRRHGAAGEADQLDAPGRERERARHRRRDA
jgi:hypothetical protein